MWSSRDSPGYMWHDRGDDRRCDEAPRRDGGKWHCSCHDSWGTTSAERGGGTLDFRKGQLRWFNRSWPLVVDPQDGEVGIIYNSPLEITGFGPDIPEHCC